MTAAHYTLTIRGDTILLDGVRYVVKHREWDCSDHRLVAATVVVRRID